MSPSDCLNKALAAGRLRKLDVPVMLKAHVEVFADLDRKLDAVRKRIEALEARDRLAKADTSRLPRA
jgi:hypothetical protein